MSYKLFLDDERSPNAVKWINMPLGPWIIVRNYREFKATIEDRGVPTFVSFDHDLADEHYLGLRKGYVNYEDYKEKTGFHCAKWLTDYCLDKNVKFPDYQVHSLNPIGKANIESLVHSFRRSQ